MAALRLGEEPVKKRDVRRAPLRMPTRRAARRESPASARTLDRVLGFRGGCGGSGRNRGAV